jgi:hypothetical protein
MANSLEGGDVISQAQQVNPSPFKSLVGKCITQLSR